MSYVSTSLSFVIAAVKKAGQALTRDFNELERLQSSIKGNKEFVGAAYQRAASTLKAELAKIRPDYAIVLPGDKMPKASHFLVSPIDGIVNFAHALPHFAINVALVENGVLTAAVVYNPAADELFFAEKGKGAFKEGYRNQERLRVSALKDMPAAVVASDIESLPLIKDCENIRVSGAVSLDMAGIAAGRMDGLVAKGRSAAEIGAGMLLVKEAGGYILEMNQKDIRTEDLEAVFASGDLIAVNANLSSRLYNFVH